MGALPSNLSPVLATYLRRCLEKEPKQRVHDIADVRLAMDGAFETTASAPSEPSVSPTLPVWQRPVVIAAIAFVGVAVGGIAVWSVTGSGPAQAVSRFELSFQAEEALTGLGRHAVAVSPDGRRVVYATSDGLSLRSLDQVNSVLMAGTDGTAREPFFSPDGQWIGFFTNSGQQVQKVATSGGAPVALGHGFVAM